MNISMVLQVARVGYRRAGPTASADAIVIDAYLVESTDPATATATHAFSHTMRG